MKRIVLIVLMSLAGVVLSARPAITGRVTADGKPLEGILVSDGREIVATDASGRYSLPAAKKEGTVFVITPSGYVAPSKDGFQPGFWAPLVKPSGKKEVVDFELVKADQRKYAVLFVSDIHLTNRSERGDLAKYVKDIPELFRRCVSKYSSPDCPLYGMNLGDLSHERFWYKNDFNLYDAKKYMEDNGLPLLFYNVPGNHDHDGAVATGDDSEEFEASHLYRKLFGPSWYSVNIGSDHWIFINDIQFINTPGKSKHPGMKGKLNYRHGFREESMKWLEKDLSFVKPGTRVFLCSHAPSFSNVSNGTVFRDSPDQVARLDSLFAPFGRVTHCTGHIHVTDNAVDSRYPHIYSRAVPATSGDCWQRYDDGLPLSFDGTDQGVRVLVFNGTSEPEEHFETSRFGEKIMRVYDLNTVGECYDGIDPAKLNGQNPRRPSYNSPEYRNGILVNCWSYQPGDRVVIMENGAELPVGKVNLEDPLIFTSFFGRMKRPGVPRNNSHMFLATAASADTPVTVRLLDGENRIKGEQIVRRPKLYSIDMY